MLRPPRHNRRLSFGRLALPACLRIGIPPAVFVLVALFVLFVLGTVGAQAAPATKVIHYRAYRLVVPAGWPVYRLGPHSTTCVRFNRHAVYLGQPGSDQLCPAHATGHTEAILVQPVGSPAGRSADSTDVLPAPSRIGATTGEGSAARLVNSADHVVVTATWDREPVVIQRALGLRSLSPAATAAMRVRPPAAGMASDARSVGRARAAVTGIPAAPGQVYTGLGFDACTTPSPSKMTAWGTSPYQAIGVYIGGANMACSQPNLTADWVSQESLAGWHLIPIYVGLQAPSNSCGCASISTAAASSQGTAAALDAVTDAQAIGLGPGNPLYADMEGYNRTTANTSAVLAFLSGWTAQLHASGYQSGVYSSADSGIVDLVSEMGTGYAEPDDLWIARWNGAQDTSDPNVPATEWAAHQRLHQYQGAHNETYGGTKINIDGDYLDAATAAVGTGSGVAVAPTAAPAPSLTVSPAADGGIGLSASWAGATGVTAWQMVGGTSSTALNWAAPPVGAAARMPVVLRDAFDYFAVQAIGAGGQVLGTSAPVATPGHVAIYGKSVFVPRAGLGGLPMGCFSALPCDLTTTISRGTTTLARTGPERVGTDGGLVYFKLPPAVHAQLSKAGHHQLLVTIKVRDASGMTANRKLTLTSFSSSGVGPQRSVVPSATVRIVGTTDFVSHGWVGGILAGCAGAVPCQPSATVSAGGKIIARTTPEALGVRELGYLLVTLTPAGHKLLAKTKTNQLPASVTLRDGLNSATGRIVLTSYS
jgi:hypothetical protein